MSLLEFYEQADKGDEVAGVFIELIEAQALAAATVGVQISWDTWVNMRRIDREALYSAYALLRKQDEARRA